METSLYDIIIHLFAGTHETATAQSEGQQIYHGSNLIDKTSAT